MKRELPAGHRSRGATWDDLPAVLALVQAVDIATLGAPDMTSEDLRSEWSQPRFDLARDVLLVSDPDGALAGYAWTWESSPGEDVDLDCYAHPDAGPGVGEALLAWALGRAQDLVDSAGKPMELSTYCAEHEARIPLLEAAGFRATRRFHRMVIELAEPPAIAAPEGVALAPLDEERDAREVHAAVQEAFAEHWGSRPAPFDEWRQRTIEREDFDPGLWVVARDAEGVAGVVIGRADVELDGGWIPTVGVLPRWRGRGLGGALLRAAFAAFFRAGYREVHLGVDSENATGATRLYEREGMRVAFVIVAFTKAGTPGSRP